MVVTKKKTEDSAKTLVLDLTFVMNKQKFDSFKDLRKEANQLLSSHRENFLRRTLKSYGIIINDTMTKREKQEYLDEKNVIITKNEDKNRDEFFIGDKLIGYWNNNPKLEFKFCRLLCKVKYKKF